MHMQFITDIYDFPEEDRLTLEFMKVITPPTCMLASLLQLKYKHRLETELLCVHPSVKEIVLVVRDKKQRRRHIVQC